MTTCRYVDGYGYFLPSHRPGCRDNACGGCVPCETDEHGNPTRHCTARSHRPDCRDNTCGGCAGCTQHLDDDHALTCPRCVGRTRGDIGVIEELAALMLDEAIERGVNSEAASLAGPAADPEAWSWRKVAARQQGTPILEDDDEHHPYAVLGRYDFMLREDYHQPTTLTVTIARSAAYLKSMLTRIAQDPGQDWPLFAGEMARCRNHLEAVLHDSRAPEKGRPCPTCGGGDEKAPALVKHYDDRDVSGASDTWRCPRDGEHRWSEADYRLRVGEDYLTHADDLTAADMAIRTGVPASTIRRWAATTKRLVDGEWVTSEPLIKSSGRSHDGRKVYRVTDVEAMDGRVAS